MHDHNCPAHLGKAIHLSDGWQGEVCDVGEGVEPWRSFLEQLVRDPTRLPGFAALKHSADRQVIRATVAALKGMPVLCRYVRADGTAAWLDRIRGSAARRDFRRAHGLLSAWIETPRPFALIERRDAASESWLITLFFDRAVDLDRLAVTILPRLTADEQRYVKNSAGRAVAEFLARLERSGWRHRDLKASNILINDWDAQLAAPHVLIADVEGLRRRRLWNESAAEEAMVRLAASLLDVPSVTRTDFARCLRAYVGAIRHREIAWRILFAGLSPRALQYARKARTRKSHKLDGYTGG